VNAAEVIAGRSYALRSLSGSITRVYADAVKGDDLSVIVGGVAQRLPAEDLLMTWDQYIANTRAVPAAADRLCDALKAARISVRPNPRPARLEVELPLQVEAADRLAAILRGSRRPPHCLPPLRREDLMAGERYAIRQASGSVLCHVLVKPESDLPGAAVVRQPGSALENYASIDRIECDWAHMRERKSRTGSAGQMLGDALRSRGIAARANCNPSRAMAKITLSLDDTHRLADRLLDGGCDEGDALAQLFGAAA